MMRALPSRREDLYPPAYPLLMVAFIVPYALAFLIWSAPSWPTTGPASPDKPETLTATGQWLSNKAARQATDYYQDPKYDQKAIFAEVAGDGYWVVYTFDARTTNVFDAKVLDATTGKS